MRTRIKSAIVIASSNGKRVRLRTKVTVIPALVPQLITHTKEK